MAPLVDAFYDVRERYLDVDIGVFDFALRCIEGPYEGKVFYINTSPSGELIGGAPGYNQVRNPEKLTLYIENAELQTKHAHISLNHHCQYTLRDMSDHHQANAGIWVKVPTRGEGIDLYEG